MVFDSLTHRLWHTIIGTVSDKKKKESKEDNNKGKGVEKLPFPQGARLLDYRENKNIR